MTNWLDSWVWATLPCPGTVKDIDCSSNWHRLLFLRSTNSHPGDTHHGVLEQILKAGQTGAVVAGIFSFDGVLEVSQEWLQVSSITEELWKHKERMASAQLLSTVDGSQRRDLLCQAEQSWPHSPGPVTPEIQTRGLKKPCQWNVSDDFQ